MQISLGKYIFRTVMIKGYMKPVTLFLFHIVDWNNTESIELFCNLFQNEMTGNNTYNVLNNITCTLYLFFSVFES